MDAKLTERPAREDDWHKNIRERIEALERVVFKSKFRPDITEKPEPPKRKPGRPPKDKES